MSAALRAEGLDFAYERGAPVLRGVGLEVARGAITGIVGPNGCGKSTLLRLLCGLLRPAAGRVLLDGVSLADLSPARRARRIGYLPQAVNPAFSLSVFEVACLGRYPHTGGFGALGPRDLAIAEESLAATRALAFRRRPFATLSGGERQRVLLASLLAQEPDLLLLDEPTSALDIHHQAEVYALLRRLAGAGYGVALVTHDLNAAGQHCDRLALLGADHAIAAEGPPEAVLRAEALRRAYEAPIVVGRHPLTGGPFVAAAPPEPGTAA